MSKSKAQAAKPAEEEVVTAQESTEVTGESVQESAEAAEVTQESQESVTDAEEEPGQGAEQEQEEQDDVPKLVKVQSLAKSSMRQPSSGWTIAPGNVREMLVDGWLENQIKAKLLQKV